MFLSPAFYGFFAALMPIYDSLDMQNIYFGVGELIRSPGANWRPRPARDPQLPLLMEIACPETDWGGGGLRLGVGGSGRLLTDAGIVCISGGVMASHSAGEWERALI